MRKENKVRFLEKIKKTRNCWNWTGFLNQSGYGQFYADRKTLKSHRYSYELFVGKIPEGFVIDHLCRNRKCVKPSHLEAVTLKENILRGVGAPAINSRKKNCPCGRAYDVKRKNGGRICRACYKKNQRVIALRWYHKNKGNGNADLKEKINQ